MKTTSSKFSKFFPYILVLNLEIFWIKFQSKLFLVVILWNIIPYTKKKDLLFINNKQPVQF